LYIPPAQTPPAPESAEPDPDPDPETDSGSDPDTAEETDEEAEPRSADTFAAGATYRLRTGTGPDLCLDTASDPTSSGVNAHQWACGATAAQRFRFGATGTANTFTLSISGNCLEVADGETKPAGNVRMGPCTGEPSQQWRVEPLGNGTHHLVAVHSDLCLDVANNSTNRGANVGQWHCNDTGAQDWTLERL
ncbi:RICIN domain-containing protein, partial [Streptomyces alkaliphilus]|uniref:RICIN domain-containing protein n=1 Tax=Streptomyces alkaliphilus TaxID=1472722 RepID=UPI00118097BE